MGSRLGSGILYGSPTVSPVTAALCASEPLHHDAHLQLYFLALSQATIRQYTLKCHK